jgi:hypothetical protein
MGDLGNEEKNQGGMDAWVRRPQVTRGPSERPRRAERQPKSTGVWRKPGAGSVPSRSVDTLFAFSTNDGEPVRSAGVEPDELAEVRARAFCQLDEWLTWIYVLDDDSVFACEGNAEAGSAYRFTLDDVLTDPADVLRYSLRTTSLLF